MIAALYVANGGCYFGLPNVDPWDQARDARLYAGPWPVVAHPPCERWGRYWFGSPSSSERKAKGDDGGCFAAALASVRKWGGVLEHPESSAAWTAFGLIAPPRDGGWVAAGDFIGWTCCVEQGHYGHRARKPTWLYAVGVDLPSLKWRTSDSSLMPPAESYAPWQPCECCEEFWCLIHLKHVFECECAPIEEWTTDPYSDPPPTRKRGKRTKNDAIERMGKRERAATPLPFRDLLIAMAESATRRKEATP